MERESSALVTVGAIGARHSVHLTCKIMAQRLGLHLDVAAQPNRAPLPHRARTAREPSRPALTRSPSKLAERANLPRIHSVSAKLRSRFLPQSGLNKALVKLPLHLCKAGCPCKPRFGALGLGEAAAIKNKRPVP